MSYYILLIIAERRICALYVVLCSSAGSTKLTWRLICLSLAGLELHGLSVARTVRHHTLLAVLSWKE